VACRRHHQFELIGGLIVLAVSIQLCRAAVVFVDLFRG
jgi:hypothetical protein